MLLILNRHRGIFRLFCRTSSIHRYSTCSLMSQNCYTKHSRIDLPKIAFSRIGTRVWNEIPEKTKNCQKNINREIKNVYYLKNWKLMVTTLKLIKLWLNLKKCYIYDLYLFICIPHVVIFYLFNFMYFTLFCFFSILCKCVSIYCPTCLCQSVLIVI